MDKLSKDEINPTLYFTYLKKNFILEWLKYDKNNKKAKLYKLIGKEVMNTHIKKMLDEILNEYNDIVFKGSHNIENCKLVKHDIRLNDKRPIKQKQLPCLTKKNKWIKEQINKLLKNWIIEPFISPYAFIIIIVRKKDEAGEGMDRICINYTSLNEVIEKNSRPILIIKEYLLLFHRVKWLTVLDLALAYWQILLTKRS